MNRGIAYIFTLLLVASLTSASCFLHSDSSLYCTDVSQEEAEQECAAYDCTSNYLSDQSCAALEVCQQITCKSSCQLEYKGKCSAGEIPDDKITEWCSSGCCRFSDSCSYKQNKWYCEVDARNKDADSFQFQVQPESECQASCENPSLFSVDTEQVSPLASVAATAIPQKKEIEEPIIEKTPITEPTINFGIVLWLVLGIIMVIGLVLLFSLKKKNVPETVEELAAEPHSDTEISNPPPPAINHIRKPLFGRADIFAKFGPAPKETQFEKLQKLSKIQERKTRHRPVPENAFSLLEKRIVKPVKSTKNDSVLKELKKMAKK